MACGQLLADELQQQFVAGFDAGLVQRLQAGNVARRKRSTGISRRARPARRAAPGRRSRRPRIRSGALPGSSTGRASHRPGAGELEQHLLAVAIVDDARRRPAMPRAACFRPCATSRLKSRIRSGGAELLELLAMVEGERHHFGPGLAAGRLPVQSFSRAASRRRKGQSLRDEEQLELLLRGHRRRAAVARHDERAAGIGVAARIPPAARRAASRAGSPP